MAPKAAVMPKTSKKSGKISAPTPTAMPSVQLLGKKTQIMDNRKAVSARIAGQSVKIYDQRGRNIASIPASGATGAVASGESISIAFRHGGVKIYDARGRHRANIP